MKPEQLRRLALATGAELEIGGQVFNAARERVLARRPADPPKVVPDPPKPPAPPAPDFLTRADVTEMLEARDAAWQMLFAELGASVAALRARKSPEYAFDFTYDERGMIVRGKATPKGS